MSFTFCCEILCLWCLEYFMIVLPFAEENEAEESEEEQEEEEEEESEEEEKGKAL